MGPHCSLETHNRPKGAEPKLETNCCGVAVVFLFYTPSARQSCYERSVNLNFPLILNLSVKGFAVCCDRVR